jgi:hypothetical protein
LPLIELLSLRPGQAGQELVPPPFNLIRLTLLSLYALGSAIFALLNTALGLELSWGGRHSRRESISTQSPTRPEGDSISVEYSALDKSEHERRGLLAFGLRGAKGAGHKPGAPPLMAMDGRRFAQIEICADRRGWTIKGR